MSDEEIDRIAGAPDSIVPSSGFAASVMEAVKRDAEVPPPIPFPWKRALPGLIICTAVLVVLLRQTSAWDPAPVIQATTNSTTGWILLAVLVSFLSVAISLRIAGRKA